MSHHTKAEREKAAAGTMTARDVVVTRVLEAPVRDAWEAMTDPDLVKRWWGPREYTAPVAEMDVREGGTSLLDMRSPEGQDFYSTWSYTKVVPMERIEFVQDLADENGTRIDPAEAGLPSDFPQGVRTKVTFKSLAEDRTELTLTEYGYTSDEWYESTKAGVEESLDKMAEIFQ